MKQINVLKTVEADQDLPSIQLSDINALADIPNWLTYIDASITDKKKLLNRVTGEAVENSSSNQAYPTVIEQNGNKWIHLKSVGTGIFMSDIGFEPEKGVTVFGVVNPEASGTDTVGSIVTSNTLFSATGESAINLGFNLRTVGTVFSTRFGGTASGSAGSTLYQEGEFANKVGLYLATFHPTRGARLYIDGLLVQEKTTAVPINKEFGAGEFQWLRQFKGLVGCVGMINSDLSESAANLSKLQNFLKEKFKIS